MSDIHVSEERFTREEFEALFGLEMPIEAVHLVFNSPPGMTIGQIRSKVREMAALRSAASPVEVAVNSGETAQAGLERETASACESADVSSQTASQNQQGGVSEEDADLIALQERAKFLRHRINELRIDYPESADARRHELDNVEAQIASRAAFLKGRQ